MKCRKCKTVVPDGEYCIKCGAKQERKQSTRARCNGMGTAYKRGKTWTASVTIGWKAVPEENRSVPVKRTKGGFATKREALEYCISLKQNGFCKKDSTIKTLYETYLATGFTKLSKSKQEAYQIAYNKISSVYFLPIESLDINGLQRLIEGMTYYPARDVKTVLSHLYKIACAQGDVPTNLAQFIVLPELDETEPIPFSDDELRHLWDAYDGGNVWVGYILLMIYSGMMPGELLKCKKEMIRLDEREIVGCGIKTKERKTRPIVIADFIVPVIESLIECNRSEKLIRINKDNFYKTYYEKLRECKCRELPPYSCRHTTGTALAIGENISPAIIQRIMRHSKFSTTQRYIHPSSEDSKAAINKLNPKQ